jgi:hypothetical protein
MQLKDKNLLQHFVRFASWSILLAVVSEPCAVSANTLPNSAKDFTVSVYVPKGVSPQVEIHASGIFKDYERHGFFRIGLMPEMVVENVRIEVRSAEALTNVMAALHSWNRPGAGARRLKLQHLEILLMGQISPCLRAAAGKIGNDGAIQLTSVSLADAAGRQKNLPAAALQLTGPTRGLVYWNENGHTKSLVLINNSSSKSP